MSRKEYTNYNDCWIFYLLLATLTILLQSIKTFKFIVFDTSISYSIILLPLIYFISNYIYKKYDYKKSIAAISLSAVLFVFYNLIISFSLGRTLDFSSIVGEFCAYIVSQFINLTIYNFIYKNTRASYILILLTYMFSLIVFYLFYTLIYLNILMFDNYSRIYFISIGINFIVCLLITFIDIKIKRGKD